VRESSTSVTDTGLPGARIVPYGIAAIVLILAVTAAFLFWRLPDANAFNDRVERLFVASEGMTGPSEIRLLEILAQSGTAFSEVLASYRMVIFVLLLFATALLIAALVFLVNLIILGRRIQAISRTGIAVQSLTVNRAENSVRLNDMDFRLTAAAVETLAALAEARMDDDFLSGAELEAVISGRPAADCDEAAGATRIKRLRDSLGNQIVSELLVKNIARKGYVLAVDKASLRLI